MEVGCVEEPRGWYRQPNPMLVEYHITLPAAQPQAPPAKPSLSLAPITLKLDVQWKKITKR